MKFYINRRVVHGPYGGGNLWVKATKAGIKAQGHEILKTDDFKARPDVIFLAGIDSDGFGISAEQAIGFKMYLKPDVKLIARINENDARKGTNFVDENLVRLSEYVDGTVFVSNWLEQYFQERSWKCAKTTVIHNGVDSEIFKPNDKLNNGKINIVAHHWSNNLLKGFDIYDMLDKFVSQHPDDFTFNYIGRENGSFRNTNVVRPLFGKALGEELGKYDVYVSASRFDPGPNHILEALACGLPTYVHKDGGGCVEFAGTDHVYNDWDQLETILKAKRFQNNSSLKLLDWDTSVTQYVKFAENL